MKTVLVNSGGASKFDLIAKKYGWELGLNSGRKRKAFAHLLRKR